MAVVGCTARFSD